MNLRLFLRHDEFKKNNIDSDYRMQLSPKMSKMFNTENATGDNQSTYSNIGVDQIKTRKITEEEYAQLTSFQTNVFLKISYFLVFVFWILAIVMIICVFNNLDTLSTTDMVMMWFGIVLFLLVGMIPIKIGIDSTVKRNSQIALGTAIFFNKVYDNRNKNATAPRYYVSVALHEQQAYVKHISCSKYDYKRMSIDSKVLILVKGRKAYAIAMNPNN